MRYLLLESQSRPVLMPCHGLEQATIWGGGVGTWVGSVWNGETSDCAKLAVGEGNPLEELSVSGNTESEREVEMGEYSIMHQHLGGRKGRGPC